MSKLNLSSITADPNQPRKNFNPERLAELMASIKKYGIINPLVVEELGGGKYMLVDGERRFRAATELKLKEVPAIIRVAMDATERIIQQFHIQEQHEGWTSTEKAVAVADLADRLGVGLRAFAAMLSLPERTISDYVAFSQLLEKKEFIKQEVPVHFASAIMPLRNFVKRTFMNELETEFTQEQERALEKAIIKRIKTGSIRIARDLTKIRDSVKAKPKSILKFIEDEDVSVDELFLKTDAKGAFAYRNTLAAASSIVLYGRQTVALGADKLFSEADKKHLQRAKEMLMTITQ